MQLAGPGPLGGVRRAASQQGTPEGNRVKAAPSPAPVPGPFLSEGQQEVRRKGWDGRRERVGGDGGLSSRRRAAAGACKPSLRGSPREAGGRRPIGRLSHAGEPSNTAVCTPAAALRASPPIAVGRRAFRALGAEPRTGRCLRGWEARRRPAPGLRPRAGLRAGKPLCRAALPALHPGLLPEAASSRVEDALGAPTGPQRLGSGAREPRHWVVSDGGRGHGGAVSPGPAVLPTPSRAGHAATTARVARTTTAGPPGEGGLRGGLSAPFPAWRGRGGGALIHRAQALLSRGAGNWPWSASLSPHKGTSGLGLHPRVQGQVRACPHRVLGVPQHLLMARRRNATSFIPSPAPGPYAVPLSGWPRRRADGLYHRSRAAGSIPELTDARGLDSRSKPRSEGPPGPRWATTFLRGGFGGLGARNAALAARNPDTPPPFGPPVSPRPTSALDS